MKKGFVKIALIIIIGVIILAFFKVDIKKFTEGEAFQSNLEFMKNLALKLWELAVNYAWKPLSSLIR